MKYEGYSVKAEQRWYVASKRLYVAQGAVIRGGGGLFSTLAPGREF